MILPIKLPIGRQKLLTPEQEQKIAELRSQGYSYPMINEELDLDMSVSTLRGIVLRLEAK
jgi:hypothetical protein